MTIHLVVGCAAHGGRLRELCFPGRHRPVEADVVGEVEAAIDTVRVGVWVVNRWRLFADKYATEPVPLDFGHVLDTAE